jgi:hypothetical protein
MNETPKDPSRRAFLKGTVAAGAAFALGAETAYAKRSVPRTSEYFKDPNMVRDLNVVLVKFVTNIDPTIREKLISTNPVIGDSSVSVAKSLYPIFGVYESNGEWIVDLEAQINGYHYIVLKLNKKWGKPKNDKYGYGL